MMREQLLREIQRTGFMLVELTLFLDTHPEDRMALERFAQTQERYAALSAEYEREYGPLKAFETDTENGWDWIQAPWPWEAEV